MGTKRICIDIGNTAIKFAVFTGSDIISSGVINSLDQVPEVIDHYEIHDAIISSVRRQEQVTLQVPGKVIWLTNETPVPVQNRYGTPHTLGMDRLAAVIGAGFLFWDKDCLVMDAGTCITLDYIDRNQTYWGGSISPGLAMRYKAMHTFTGRLPLVEMAEEGETPLIGRTTTECLKSGVLNGTLAEITGLISKYRQHSPDLITVVCGGDAPFFEKNLKERIFVVPDLVLIGLNRILKYNV